MKRRELSELIDLNDPAWPLILDWLKSARNSVQVVPNQRSQGENTLFQLQVTTRSPMGAVALECSGLLIDHGWIRILGSGDSNPALSLLTWNHQNDQTNLAPIKGVFVVAHDVVGGFFVINGGKFQGKTGNIFYLAPDTLQWEDLNRSYSDFLYWTLHGDLERYYLNVRWSGWENEIHAVSPSQGVSIYPPLWAQGPGISQRSRRSVPIYELWNIYTQGLK